MRFRLYTTRTRPRAAIGSWRLRGGSYKDFSQSGNTDRKQATRSAMGAPGGKINRPRTVTVWGRRLFPKGPRSPLISPEMGSIGQSLRCGRYGVTVRGLRLISVFLPHRS